MKPTSRTRARAVFASIATAIAAHALISCGAEELALKVCPAVPAAADAEPPTGWTAVEFAGSQHAAAGTYHVREKPLFTEWNLMAAKGTNSGDKAQVTVRFNEYARRQIDNFSSDAANLKKPLALNLDGRWLSFTPLLRPPGDRLTLYGFTPAEAERVEQFVASK
mgnify:CR=1 FL=1